MPTQQLQADGTGAPLPRRAGSWLLKAALVAAAYAVCGKLGLLLAIPPGYATAVWPPSGVALAAVMLGGARLWPGVMLGSFLVNVSTSWDASTPEALARSLAIALAIAGGAALQAVVGGWLIRRFVGYRNIFTQEVDVVRILLYGAPLSCLINSFIGTGTLWWAGLVPTPNLLFNWWTWWVGDSIGVLIFMPLICAWALPGRQWLGRQVSLTLPLAAMFVAMVGLFFFVSSREQTRLQGEFDRTAQRIAAAFQARLDNDLVVLDAINGLLTVSDRITAQQFHDFVAPRMQGRSDIKALEWLPRVGDGERAGFEETMRAAARPGFRIWEKDSQGRDVPAATRPEYFPVTYLEPFAGNAVAQGYDDNSEPTRSAALRHAITTGRTTATARIRLVQERGEQWGTIVFSPVFRNGAAGAQQPGQLLGFALAVFRIGDLVQAALQEAAASGLELRLLDAALPPDQGVLYQAAATEQLKPRQIARSRSITVNMAERQWSLDFILPADYLVSHRSWQAWGLLAVGLLITGMLGILILVLIGRESKVEELVQSRTSALRAAQLRFRRLLENTPDAMVITDHNGIIQLVNARIEQLFGYSREEMIGQPVELMVPDRQRPAHTGHRAAFFGSPQARPMGAGLELWGRRKDGTEVPVEISLSPLETEEGVWATAAIRDISERKAAEQKLASYAKDLERSNAELEQFAYVASHDLQAPLRSIVGFGQLLQADYKGRFDADADTYIGFMVNSAGQMQSLIRDLLTYSRIGRGSALGGSADCGQVLAEVLAQLRPLIQERNALITHDPLPEVACAPLELGQIFQNLIGNAIKFQNAGSRPLIHIGAQRDGEFWRLSVRDNGIGIDARYRERIFHMFQRLHTPDKFEGTGIGLAICRKIVLRHGGRLWVESEPGRGSTFYFTFAGSASGAAA